VKPMPNKIAIRSNNSSSATMAAPFVVVLPRSPFRRCRQTRAARVWSSGAYDDFRAALLGDTPPEVYRGCSMYRGVF
jgi:hypothetical protein